jgi:hypothetical protein
MFQTSIIMPQTLILPFTAGEMRFQARLRIAVIPMRYQGACEQRRDKLAL